VPGACARILILLILSLCPPLAVYAQDVLSLRADAPPRYVVKPGDSLWSIAEQYLQEPWQWPELWQVNPKIDNPHLIYPGDTLTLVQGADGPRLRVLRGRDVKLSPDMRVGPLERAIPAIPLDQIGAFLRRHRVVDADVLAQSAYIVAAEQDHLITAAGDLIYGRGVFPPEERVFGIYRTGDLYRDPITNEILGYQASDIGDAQLRDNARGDVEELEITRVTEEVRIGDRLLPQEERILDASFQPRPPDFELGEAFMIAVDGGVNQIGATDIVVINRGARDGLEIGHVLVIYQSGALAFDAVARTNVYLPDTRAGLVMVFDVAEKVSYALVMKANRPLKVMDKVRAP
jgi:LysM repeat protein